jgi:toxin CptA
MNNKMKPIRLNFKPSITLTLIICTMGLGAGAILILPALIWQIKLMLSIFILSAVIYTVCQYGLLLLPWSYIALNVSSSNQLQLVRRDGKHIDVRVCSDSVVTPYLTVVNCQVTDAPLVTRLLPPRLVILPDALDAESYRQLRVWLRWGKTGDGLR